MGNLLKTLNLYSFKNFSLSKHNPLSPETHKLRILFISSSFSSQCVCCDFYFDILFVFFKFAKSPTPG